MRGFIPPVQVIVGTAMQAHLRKAAICQVLQSEVGKEIDKLHELRRRKFQPLSYDCG